MRVHFLGLCLFLVACGDDDRTDAGSLQDATPDAPSADVSADTVASDAAVVDAPAPPEDAMFGPAVRQCRIAAEALEASCAEVSEIRFCEAALDKLQCNELEDRPDEAMRLTAAFDCLVANISSFNRCPRFSRMNGPATECVAAVYEGVENAQVETFRAHYRSACGDQGAPEDYLWGQAQTPLYALSEAQLTTLNTCVGALPDCEFSGFLGCFEMIRPLAPYLACMPRPERTRCVGSASALTGACAGDAAGACRAAAYEATCQVAGEDDARRLADALDCLANAATTDTCPSFEDQGEAAACVQNAYGNLVDEGTQGIVDDINAACGGDLDPTTTPLPIYVTSGLRACLNEASGGSLTCPEVESCYLAVYANLSACR